MEKSKIYGVIEKSSDAIYRETFKNYFKKHFQLLISENS